MTVSQRYPPTPVAFRKAQNLEPGVAELVQQSAGMDATLEGHMRGGPTVGGAANPAPLNPSGEPGHDHSGGEFGVPLFRSVASVTLSDGCLLGGSAVAIGNKPGTLTVPNDPGGGTNRSEPVALNVWVPPCDPVEGAYLSLGFAAEVHLQNSSLVSGDTATLRVWSRSSLTFGHVAERAVPLPATEGAKLIEAVDGDTRIPVRPGAMNEVFVQLEVTRDSGGSARGIPRAWLTELELGVFEVP